MSFGISLGRSMTAIGFGLLLVVALSACSKKKAVNQDGTVGIFEIALPATNNPNLTDYTAEDLGEGVYEATKLGFRLEPFPIKDLNFTAQVIHTLVVAGQVDPSQDQVEYSFSGDAIQDAEVAFFLHERVELRKGFLVPAKRYAYNAIITPDQQPDIYEDNGADLHLISEYLQDAHRTRPGVYEYPSEHTSVYVIKTSVGFSVYFLIYDGGARLLGRIDYVKVSQ